MNKDLVWLGTRNGIILYDLRTDRIIDHFLSGLSITALTIDFEGNTWFTTLEQGAFMWPNSKVRTIQLSNELGISSKSLYCDVDGQIWVGLLGDTY